MADQGTDEVNELLGHAAGVHQLTGHDEEGNAGQAGNAHARKDLLGNDVEVGANADGNDVGNAGKAQHNANGDTQDQGDQKYGNNCDHPCSPPSSIAFTGFLYAPSLYSWKMIRYFSRARITRITMPITMGR